MKKQILVAWLLFAGVVLAMNISNAADAIRIFRVKNFGAIGDGKTLDTRAIQSAIDAANQAGGGRVVLSPGIFLSGSLHLKSHVELRVESGATLLGSASRSDYQKNNKWFALLLADGQEGVVISGTGTIDGQGRELAQDVIRRIKTGEINDPMERQRPAEGQRPLLLAFRNCSQVRVSGVTLRNSSCWVEDYDQCDGLVIENIHVNSTAFWNNDGIDITDCTKVRVTGCDLNSADDGICLKSEMPDRACEDVLIEHCRIRSSASALKFGTASHGGFRRVKVHDLYIYDTYRSAVALEAVDGGVLEDVAISKIKAVHTGNAIFIKLGHRNREGSIGSITNVTISDLDVEVPSGRPDAGYEIAGPEVREPHNLFPSSVTGLPGHPVRGVTLRNIKITYGGGEPLKARVPLRNLNTVPENEASYPEFSMFGELPAAGFYCRHVEGIKFENVTLRFKDHDLRPSFVADDVKNLGLDGFSVLSPETDPAILLNNVNGASIRRVKVPPGVKNVIREQGNCTEIQRN